jgi:hypothetical protein
MPNIFLCVHERPAIAPAPALADKNRSISGMVDVATIRAVPPAGGCMALNPNINSVDNPTDNAEHTTALSITNKFSIAKRTDRAEPAAMGCESKMLRGCERGALGRPNTRAALAPTIVESLYVLKQDQQTH